MAISTGFRLCFRRYTIFAGNETWAGDKVLQNDVVVIWKMIGTACLGEHYSPVRIAGYLDRYAPVVDIARYRLA